jgi:hypothetical protein
MNTIAPLILLLFCWDDDVRSDVGPSMFDGACDALLCGRSCSKQLMSKEGEIWDCKTCSFYFIFVEYSYM